MLYQLSELSHSFWLSVWFIKALKREALLNLEMNFNMWSGAWNKQSSFQKSPTQLIFAELISSANPVSAATWDRR